MNFVIKIVFEIVGMLILMSFWGVSSSELGFTRFFLGWVCGMIMYDLGGIFYRELEKRDGNNG